MELDFSIISQNIYITQGFIVLYVYNWSKTTTEKKIGKRLLTIETQVKDKNDTETIILSLIVSVPIMGFVYLLQKLTGRPCFDYLLNYVIISWATAFLVGLFFGIRHQPKSFFLSIIQPLRTRRAYLSSSSVWNKLFIDNPNTFYRFSLSDGRIYIGKVEHFSINPNMEERGVFIRPSIMIENDDEVVGSFERGTYIEGEDIISIDILESLDIKYEGRVEDQD